MDIKIELEWVYSEAVKNGKLAVAFDCLRELRQIELMKKYSFPTAVESILQDPIEQEKELCRLTN